MSSTMSMLRMPSHSLSPSTSPTRPTRMSTTPKICANRLTIMRRYPPACLLVCCHEVYGLSHDVDAQGAGIVRSLAQKTNPPRGGLWKRRGLVSEEASCHQSGNDQYPHDRPGDPRERRRAYPLRRRRSVRQQGAPSSQHTRRHEDHHGAAHGTSLPPRSDYQGYTLHPSLIQRSAWKGYSPKFAGPQPVGYSLPTRSWGLACDPAARGSSR